MPASSKSISNRTAMKPKVLRDPVHDLISLASEDRSILDLIDTKEFQRLRRIRQLGLANLVFPSAEHTRFSHSLGVFNFARRILERLKRRSRPNERKELGRNEGVIKAAALLHDIGHGPFSHVYERVFEDEDSRAQPHEEWACRIMLDGSTEIHKRLGSTAAKVAALVWDNAPQHFRGVESPDHPYLKDVVSSQLDADRMDYLLRDSMMTGSRYGLYDVEWILNALCLGSIRSRPRTVRKLCLDASKGTGAIEELLFARFLMTQHIYGHKTTRAYEAEMIAVLRLAFAISEHLPSDTPEPVQTMLRKKGNLSVKEYLLLDDEVVWWALRRWAVWSPQRQGEVGPDAKALQRHALNLVRRRPPWKTVPLLAEEQITGAVQLVQELTRKCDPLMHECYLDKMEVLPYKEPAGMMSRGADPEEAFYGDIFLIDADGEAQSIRSRGGGGVLQGLAKPWRECRFHYDRKFSAKFTRLLRKYGVC
jgi:HD superfamily phosphohydrolase